MTKFGCDGGGSFETEKCGTDRKKASYTSFLHFSLTHFTV